MTTGPNFLQRLRFLCHLRLRARILPLLVRQKKLSDVLALAEYDHAPAYEGLSSNYICSAVMRATARPLLMRDRRCLREGLLGFYFLKAAGFSPELRFALLPSSLNEDKARAHCWVALSGQPVLNDNIAGMIEIYKYPQSARPS